MRFSILIPVYNVEKYIEECIDSCLNQTFGDFEIIIINDGSRDGSVALCEKYKDDRIKIYHKENGGLLMARRDAIPKAVGEYLIFLDSDDKLRPDCLETVNGIIEKKENGYDVVLYNLYNWNSDTGEEKVRKPVFEDGAVFGVENKKALLEKFLLTAELNNLVLKAVRREIAKADDTPYSEMGDSSYGEDKLQTFFIFDKAESIYYSSEPLYYYRNNPTSITNASVPPEKAAKQISVHIELMSKKYMDKWGLNTEENQDILCVRRLLFLRDIFKKSFNSCKTKEERKRCLSYDWFSLILPENVDHLNSKKLSFLQRTELKAIYKKNYFKLNLLRIIKGFVSKLRR